METSNRLEKTSSEELLERKADLEKALSSHQFHTVVSCLKVLQKTQITRQLLEDTMIGKTLTSCSKLVTPKEHGDLEGDAEKIRNISGEILVEWKKINKMEKQKQVEVPLFKEESKLSKKISENETTLSTNISFWSAGEMFIPPSLKLDESNKFRRSI